MKRAMVMAGLASVVLAGPLATSADAAGGNNYTVCNSSYSLKPLYLFEDGGDGFVATTPVVYPGDCFGTPDTAASNLRIDPDKESLWGETPDVSRYRIGEIGSGYRDWVDNDPDTTINPPDAWANANGGSGVRVHTD